MFAELLSSVGKSPTSYLVYSSMSAFADVGRGELPGTWFVEALGRVGHAPNAVRQTLYRMTRNRELSAEKRGRTNYYRMTPYGRAEIQAGWDKIFTEPDADWDERWTLVHYAFSDAQRVDRDRVRAVLGTLGFAPIGTGLWIHPRDHGSRVAETAAAMGVGKEISVYRADRHHPRGHESFVRRLWDLDGVAQGYRAFVERFRRLAARNERIQGEEAFALRFAVVIDFLKVAWSDPDLPGSLLPRSWPGNKARAVARRLYDGLLPESRRFAARILENRG